MVTYAELFQFCLVVIGIINLVILIAKKEVIAVPSNSRRLLRLNLRG